MDIVESWHAYLHAYERLVELRMSMHPFRQELVEHIGASIFNGGLESFAALDYVGYLEPELALGLLPRIVCVAISFSGSAFRAREIVLSLPREAVIAKLESLEPEILDRKDYEEYSGLISLWIDLGCKSHALELALRAAADSAPDLQDIGKLFLDESDAGNPPARST